MRTPSAEHCSALARCSAQNSVDQHMKYGTARQRQVEDHQVDLHLALAKDIERFLPVLHQEQLVAVTLKNRSTQVANHRLIVDEEDRLRANA
jgi:hypothetical protein